MLFVYLFRRHAYHELVLNNKKQKRAIELLNKKNVIYAYYTNFLKFEYDKYKVRNSTMLSSNLKDYDNYKHLVNRYDQISKILYQVFFFSAW